MISSVAWLGYKHHVLSVSPKCLIVEIKVPRLELKKTIRDPKNLESQFKIYSLDDDSLHVFQNNYLGIGRVIINRPFFEALLKNSIQTRLTECLKWFHNTILFIKDCDNLGKAFEDTNLPDEFLENPTFPIREPEMVREFLCTKLIKSSELAKELIRHYLLHKEASEYARNIYLYFQPIGFNHNFIVTNKIRVAIKAMVTYTLLQTYRIGVNDQPRMSYLQFFDKFYERIFDLVIEHQDELSFSGIDQNMLAEHACVRLYSMTFTKENFWDKKTRLIFNYTLGLNHTSNIDKVYVSFTKDLITLFKEMYRFQWCPEKDVISDE